MGRVARAPARQEQRTSSLLCAPYRNPGRQRQGDAAWDGFLFPGEHIVIHRRTIPYLSTSENTNIANADQTSLASFAFMSLRSIRGRRQQLPGP